MNEEIRPLNERCGLTAGELTRWHETTAHLGLDMDARFAAVYARYHRTAPHDAGWARRAAICCAGACLLIALVLMIGAS